MERRDALKILGAATATGALGVLGCQHPVARTPASAAPVPLTVRPGSARGHFDHGWLDTRHTFSFARYHDPRHMGFRSLRVINEDRVQAGAGFPLHPHRDMEILTYVLNGALQHRDTLGNGGIIRPGLVQYMRAGRGIRHSEFNNASDEAVHFLQIWIRPAVRGTDPGYAQRAVPKNRGSSDLALIASGDGRGGSLRIQQDADLFAARLRRGEQVAHTLRAGRAAWLQIARGTITVAGTTLRAGDGASVPGGYRLVLRASSEAEALLFDLA